MNGLRLFLFNNPKMSLAFAISSCAFIFLIMLGLVKGYLNRNDERKLQARIADNLAVVSTRTYEHNKIL
jgi:hypothetical protein